MTPSQHAQTSSGSWTGRLEALLLALTLALVPTACKPEPMEQAQALMAAGDPAGAAQIYAGLSAPERPEVQLALAQALEAAGQLQDAAKAYAKLPEPVKGVDGARVEALALALRGDHAAAEVALTALAAAHPSDPAVQSALGEVQGLGGDLASSKAAFQRALALDPQSAAAHIGLGDLAFASGDIREAQRLYETAIALGGETKEGVKARTRLARLQMALGEDVVARELLNEARTLMRDHPATNAEVGKFMVRSGFLTEALPLLKDAQRALGEDPDLLSYIGYVFKERARRQYLMGARMKDLQAAQMWFERVIKVDPARYDVLGDLGTVRALLGDVEGAEEAFLAAYEVSPTRLEALMNLGRLYVDSGQVARARSVFDRGLSLDPENVILQINLGVLALREGDEATATGYFDAAEATCLALPSDHPCRPELFYNRARIAGRQGRTEDAVQDFLRAWGAGYRDMGRILAEPDLAAAREDIRVANQLDAFRMRISN